jgi:hypothetical protein
MSYNAASKLSAEGSCTLFQTVGESERWKVLILLGGADVNYVFGDG